MQIDVEKIVLDKIKEMDAGQVLEKAIAEHVEKAIMTAVETTLKSHKIKNIFEEKLTEEISKVAGDLNFSSYNGFIANAIKNLIETTLQKDVQEKIEQRFKEILLVKRESIKLSEIFDAYREYICKDTEEADKYNYERFYINVEEDEVYRWLTIKLGPDNSSDFRKNSYHSIEFSLHRKSKEEDKATISTLYIGGKDMGKAMNLGFLDSFKSLLANLLYNNTTIELDVEDYDDLDNSYDIDI